MTQLVPALRSMDLVKAGVEGWWGDITHMVKLATGEVTYGDYSVGVPANLGAESCAVLATYWVTFAIFLYFVDKYVLPPFSRFMVGDELSKDSEGGKTGTPLRVKYSIAVRELAFYAFSTTVHIWLYALRHQWAWPSGFHLLYQHRDDIFVEREMRFTAFFETTWYMVTVVFLFMDFKRKDFAVMVAHHLITIALIWTSWQPSHVHTGAVVIMLHNPSDVLLQLAKLCSYKAWAPFDTIFFVLLAISWPILRLYAFPLFIKEAFTHEVLVENWQPVNALGSWLLAALVPLHLYWFVLILKVIVKAVTGGGLKDNREEGDGVDSVKAKETKKTA